VSSTDGIEEVIPETPPETIPPAAGTPPGHDLTLAPERLAGSAACLNCGTVLQGPYCYYCGQPDRNFMRFFPSLLRDLMEDFLDFDSRFMRTMKPLLFRPGRLTRDFLDGRRFRYTPPLRLYIFASVVFFLMAAALSSNAVRIEPGLDNGESEVNIRLSPPVILIGEAPVEDAVPADAEEHGDALQNGDEASESTDETDEPIDYDSIQFNDEPWDKETNPVVVPGSPDFLNEWVNNEIEQSPQKAREIEKNPRLIVDKIFDVLPVTMFILLPVAALLFKFWYLFAKRYYIEHLIFSLHNHSYIFVSMIISLLLGVLEDACVTLEWQIAANVFEWGAILILAWIPFYFLFALKRVYQQGWFMTILKYGVIGLSYILLLALVTSAAAISSFVLL
jgi:hypothetical protein